MLLQTDSATASIPFTFFSQKKKQRLPRLTPRNSPKSLQFFKQQSPSLLQPSTKITPQVFGACAGAFVEEFPTPDEEGGALEGAVGKYMGARGAGFVPLMVRSARLLTRRFGEFRMLVIAFLAASCCKKPKTSFVVSFGSHSKYMAATPTTCGTDDDVPDLRTDFDLSFASEFAERIATPGLLIRRCHIGNNQQ